MGGIGPSFIDKQFHLLGIYPEDVITPEDVKKLARSARENSTLLIGKSRSSQLYDRLMELARK